MCTQFLSNVEKFNVIAEHIFVILHIIGNQCYFSLTIPLKLNELDLTKQKTKIKGYFRYLKGNVSKN